MPYGVNGFVATAYIITDVVFLKLFLNWFGKLANKNLMALFLENTP